MDGYFTSPIMSIASSGSNDLPAFRRQHVALLGQIAAAAEVLALAADHQHLHFIVGVGFMNQVRIVLTHADVGRVQGIHPVEGQIRNAILPILLVADVLLRFFFISS